MKGAREIFIDNKSEIGVLLLHGFTSSPCRFEELAAFLSDEGFSVYAPLIAGHGTTAEDLMRTSPDDWTSSVIAAYWKLKQTTNRVVVVGASFGANLAFWLEQEISDNLAGIISLSAPVFLRFQNFIKFRYWTYGRFKTYYRKPSWANWTDSIDRKDDIVYPIIPIKSLKDFLDFVNKDTILHLPNVKAPILIAQSVSDPLLRAQSAQYIFNTVGSEAKELHWFKIRRHNLICHDTKEELFEKIYDFIKKIK